MNYIATFDKIYILFFYIRYFWKI